MASVTVGSIRWRILKGSRPAHTGHPSTRYSGLDPMEDTESLALALRCMTSASGYSGLDPMEDTESVGTLHQAF